MEIREIPLDDIHLGERLRQTDPDHVRIIARSIEEQGQRTPIDVRQMPDGTLGLIAGAHRMEACREVGLTTVLAIVHDVDDLTASLIEVDENLMRHELTALDRAAFLVRRKSIYEAKFPAAKAGGKRPKGQEELDFPLTAGFSRDTAAKLNLSRRWVSRAIQYHQDLTPEARKLLSGTRLADNANLLIAISKLAKSEQVPVIKAMTVPHAPARSVAEATARLFDRTLPGIDPVDAAYRRTVRDLATLGAPLLDRVTEYLRRQGYRIAPPKAR